MTDYYEEAATEESPQPSIGTWARLIGVITSPVQTFEDIARVPNWWRAAIVIALLSLPATLALLWFFDAEKVMTMEMEKSGHSMPSGEQAEMALRVGKIFWWLTPVFQIFIGMPLFWLALGGIFYVSLKLAGGVHTFAQTVSIAVHATVIPTLQGWLAIPVIAFATDRYALDLRNIVRSNATLFLPEDSPKTLYSLASSLDVFSFWMLAVLAIGLGAASKRPVGSAVAVALWWLLYVLVKIGIAAWFG